MSTPNGWQPTTGEPVAIHTAVVTLLGAITAALWGTMPDATLLDGAVSGVAALIALGSWLVTRGKVQPVKPTSS